jgi:release factor glutamine methyltransferase
MQEAKSVWTIIKILDWTKQYFQSKGVDSPRLDAEVLLCDVLHCSRLHLYTNFDQPLQEEELKKYREYVARRVKREPVAYILGQKGFMKEVFKVTKDTLIPRPETELLVEKILSLKAFQGDKEILDIGCGSGIIIISLLLGLPQARGLAIDIDPSAVAVTLDNAKALGVEERCAGLVSDLFEHVLPDDKFDLIVSNPPYIPSAVIPTLEPEVRQEPVLALDGGKDGLDFYRRILEQADNHLLPQGLLALEIGIDEGKAVAEMCKAAGFKATAVCLDYAGIERMVFATKKGTIYADEIMAFNK